MCVLCFSLGMTRDAHLGALSLWMQYVSSKPLEFSTCRAGPTQDVLLPTAPAFCQYKCCLNLRHPWGNLEGSAASDNAEKTHNFQN